MPSAQSAEHPDVTEPPILDLSHIILLRLRLLLAVNFIAKQKFRTESFTFKDLYVKYMEGEVGCK